MIGATQTEAARPCLDCRPTLFPRLCPFTGPWACVFISPGDSPYSEVVVLKPNLIKVFDSCSSYFSTGPNTGVCFTVSPLT